MQTITKIEIKWAESNLVEEGTTFDHLLKANRVLEMISHERGSKGGYTKVAYAATFSDGANYTGRFDVHGIDSEQETSNGALCFLQAMRDFVSFKAGLRKPEWMTDEQYASAIDRSEEILEWVERLGLAA
jgi:hypothetical protein